MLKKYILSFFIILMMLAPSTQIHATSEDTTPSGIPIPELEEKVDTYMESYIGKATEGAAVVIISNGQVILSKGYGFADKEHQITIDPSSSVFEYASISKLFTWTAVMQQVEAGKIDLQADIMTYLSDNFKNTLKKALKYDTPITMLDLMNYTAGFEDIYFDGSYTDSSLLSNTLEEALLKFMPRQVYKPGTVQAYSNFGAALAGYIVEQVTGKRLYDYIQANIFDVINMDSTTADPNLSNHPGILQNKVQCFTALDESTFMLADWIYCDTYPDGSLNGTAEDLSKFLIALMSDECPLFKEQQTLSQMLTTTYVAHPNMAGNSHGFWNLSGPNNYFHDGGHNGFTSIAAFDPDAQFGVVVLSNTGDETRTTYGLTSYLMASNVPEPEISSEPLPSVDDVTGIDFISTRRSQTDMTSVYAYLDGCVRAEKVDDNTISLNGLKYVQVSPYYYRVVDDRDNHIIKAFYSQVYFLHDGNEVTGFTYGTGIEFERAPLFRNNLWLVIQGISFILFSIFFILYFIIVSIVKLTNSKNTFSLVSLFGLLLVINQTVLVIRLLSSNQLVAASFQIHVILNWIIVVISLIIVFLTIRKLRKEHPPKKVMVHYMIVGVIYVLTVTLLASWNFFSFL